MNCIKFIATLFLITLIAFSFSACEKETNTQLFWQTTKCKDPWHKEDVSPESTTYLENMRTHLTDNGIIFINNSVRRTTDGVADDNCTGCSCKLTQRIAASFAEEYVAAAKALGFTEN